MNQPANPPRTADALYDASYYRESFGEPYERNEIWLGLSGRFADRIVSDFRPARVLDAGCGMGFLVEMLRARGVEAYGVDVSSYAIANVYDPIKPFCWHGSIADELPADYDLIVSIEVLEHMPPAEGVRAIENVCRHTGDVLFSSSPIDYRDVTHVNVQQPDYWVEQFARQGFFRDVDFDGTFLTPWAIRFRRRTDPVHRIVRDYERRLWELLAERGELRAVNLEMREKLAAAASPRSFGERLMGRLRRAVGRRG